MRTLEISVTGNSFKKKFEKIIKEVIEETVKYKNIKGNIEVSVTLTDSDDIKKINTKYRHKNKVTDVLSFPMLKIEEIKKLKENDFVLLGDIIICIEQADKQRIEYNHSIEREIAFLTAHSMLHLLGYDHNTQKNEEKMFYIQEDILKKTNYFRR